MNQYDPTTQDEIEALLLHSQQCGGKDFEIDRLKLIHDADSNCQCSRTFTCRKCAAAITVTSDNPASEVTLATS